MRPGRTRRIERGRGTPTLTGHGTPDGPMAETMDGLKVDPEVARAVFKAYDVRGTVPDQIGETLACATG